MSNKGQEKRRLKLLGSKQKDGLFSKVINFYLYKRNFVKEKPQLFPLYPSQSKGPFV